MLFAGGASLAGGSAYALHSVDLDISLQRIPLNGIEQKMRIVALSDLHAPCFYLSASDLIRTINATKADILILGGDMFGTEYFDKTITEFKKSKAKYAKLAILGNWEYQLKLNLKILSNAYKNAGIKLLVNNTVEVNGLRIIGLDDFLHGSPNYHLASKVSSGAFPNLIVSHCPGVFNRINSDYRNSRMVISGHTHGGQIAPFGKVLVTPPGSGPYIRGWYYRGNNSMYVMRGVGASYFPLRIGARPELLVLDLIPA